MSLDPCDWVGSAIVDYLQSTAGTTSAGMSGSEFAIECFNRYWSGTGKGMNLAGERFEKIKAYIPSRSKSDIYDRNMQAYIKNEKTYYKSQVSFYNTPYALSLGTATVVYDASFKPVGLYDTYNFDSFKNRTWPKEGMVLAVRIAGTGCGAKAFNIYYGTY